jgi:energy-coupling factor transporter ATP-binding protein EcfA2
MAGDSLIEWSDRQAAWVRDALRRIASAPRFTLSEEDQGAVQARVANAAAADGEAGPVCEPLTAEMVASGSTTGPRTLLTSLGPVTNVDQMAADQELRFALDGITLIYGDNGSGKSGYARIAKRLCRSLRSDPLRSNVYQPAGAPGAVIKFKVGDDAIQEIAWREGDAAPAALQQLSVFDTQNARVYVDEQNRIAYLPPELAILEQHGALCGTLNAAFDVELKALNTRVKVPLPAGYAENSSVSGMLKRIDPKAAERPSKADLEALAKRSPEEIAEQDALATRFAQDPAVLATTRRRGVQVLTRLVTIFTDIEAALSDGAAQQLIKLHDEARVANAAESLAAEAQFAGEPIGAVGGQVWRALFDAARAFALGDDPAPGLPAAPEDLCALCQEPLGDAGAARLSRFNAFVQSQAATVAKVARDALEGARGLVEALVIPPESIVADQLAAYADLSHQRRIVAADIGGHLRAMSERKAALLTLGQSDSAPLTAAPQSLLPSLRTDIEALTSEAETLDKTASHTAGLDVARARLAELKDREKLAQDLAFVLQRLEDVQRVVLLKACQGQVGTAGVSRQITTLRKALVTDDLQRRIAAEISLMDLQHLPLRTIDSSAQGQSRVAIGLHGVEKTPNSQILSEGEQRALALACFLAEVADHGAGLIVDDPVSSLDHLRLPRVAARLVAEAAKGRQVIVFTHNIVFFNEVIMKTAEAGDRVRLHKVVVRKTEAGGFGVVGEGVDPWAGRDVKARLGDLRERAAKIAKIVDADDEARRATAKDFYTDLRETWERTVEEVVFCKTLQRLDPAVMTQSLKGVCVTDDDYRTIYFAMKRTSERSGHDRPLARDTPIPTPDEMSAEVDALEAFRSEYVGRSSKLAERRKALERPALATLA